MKEFAMTMLRIVLLLLPLMASGTLQPTASRAEEGQRVILVLDASGSMWGKIDGKPKMQIAKEVVGKVIADWKPADEIGLVAYGHRKKGACDDIELLAEPGQLDASSFMSKVKALNPKGKTPMTQAVRQAAEALKFTEKQATVILVSDGLETCDPNPCAVAEELERLGVGLTVHTVGFGLDDKAAVGQLKCLAENTGGISIIAENADQLQDALAKTVEAKPEPEPEPAPPPPEPAAPEFNLRGSVTMAEGIELPQGFDTPTWEVAKSIAGEKGVVVKTEYGAAIKTNIEEPGDHVLEVSNDAAKLSVPITIAKDNPLDLALSFEAGVVRFSAKLDPTTAMTDAAAAWELADQNGRWISTKYGPQPAFFASAGTYKMRLSLGSAKIEQDVTFTSGKIEDVVLMLGAGVVEVNAVFAPGGPPVLAGAAIELRKGEANIDGQHEWMSTNYGPNVKFDVAAGRYRIVATQDYATGFADVEVRPGQAAKAEVSVNGGFLSVTAQADATLEAFSGTKDIAGNRVYIATEYNGKLNKAFAAGTVHIVAKSPDGTILGERDFEIKAGQRTEGTVP
jgi:Ca-activated chloride channel family protein